VASRPELDKKKLVSSLEVSDDGMDGDDGLSMDRMSLGLSLLKLANIDQEQEFQLCRALAKHLLAKVPEPEEIDLD
jgi:hypothetical protein